MSMSSMSGGGSCGGGWMDGVWLLGVDGGRWVASRGVVGVGRVGLFELRRLMRRVERGGAMVMVMRLMGGSCLR